MPRSFVARSLAVAALALTLGASALAGPLDKKAETAIVETIKMTTSGDFDGWIAKWCDPTKCDTNQRKDQWKAYQLKSAKTNAGACLQSGDKVKIARWQGQLTEDGSKAKAYIVCEGRQMPVPIELRWDPKAKRMFVRSISF